MELHGLVHETSGHLECRHCSFKCINSESLQSHIGTTHPEHCGEMDVGGLGKVMFYQKSAKLFHCQICFFTSKVYCNVYQHVITIHAVPEKPKEEQESPPEVEAPKVGFSVEELPPVKSEDSEVTLPEKKKPTVVEKTSVPDADEVGSSASKTTSLKKRPREESEDGCDGEVRSSDKANGDNKMKVGLKEYSSDEEQQVDYPYSDYSDYNPPQYEADTESSKSDNILEPPEGKEDLNEEAEMVNDEDELAKYVRRGKGKYFCKICNCRAINQGVIMHHVSMRHDVPSPYTCKECGRAFVLRYLLQTHMAIHKRQGFFKCSYCNFASDFPRGLKKHLKHCLSRQSEVKSGDPSNQEKLD
ncbi:chromosome alignment-maintaining phosphoprotein 1 [Latimeria chalumnae]|uniref:chromosome alignment-maintaining phosphoprotein 1 n=1 Tax=Latimeria chalumnae TaxID=7897 RepID=UPI0003C12F02|nr:PREDICTED: chromosome alignment-maintaining phosphoprotein 1 [Latimeria chalumnae]|eukprot:XP_006011756.1 PREDICTED: chromosome alignment-maintaining phosphoprotein 1 [Latimeria chalumnae]